MWSIFQIKFYFYSPSSISETLHHFCFIHTEQHLRIETQQWSVAVHNERRYGLHFSTPGEGVLQVHMHNIFSVLKLIDQLKWKNINWLQQPLETNEQESQQHLQNHSRHKLYSFVPNEIKRLLLQCESK